MSRIEKIIDVSECQEKKIFGEFDSYLRIIEKAFDVTVIAVSYTHLDVYKRQVRCTKTNNSHNFNIAKVRYPGFSDRISSEMP